MKGTVKETDFQFEGQIDFYRGKVRDVYFLNNDLLVMVTTDRISAFDVILPQAVPYKGQVLNKLAGKFLDDTSDIVPNWKVSQPDPNVTIGKKCTPFKVEMVVRGYLAGHAWREYRDGKREICGVPLPGGLRQNEKFPHPVITPTTKADHGHDEDISKEEIIGSGLVDKKEYEQLEEYALNLFERGSEHAKSRGLILVDTKYEFGKDKDGNITLIDEIHTPDSSRYFYRDEYARRLEEGKPQRQLSKEFVREALMKHGYQGENDKEVPVFPASFISEISDRYIELYEKITGDVFEKHSDELPLNRIQRNIEKALKAL